MTDVVRRSKIPWYVNGNGTKITTLYAAPEKEMPRRDAMCDGSIE